MITSLNLARESVAVVPMQASATPAFRYSPVNVIVAIGLIVMAWWLRGVLLRKRLGPVAAGVERLRKLAERDVSHRPVEARDEARWQGKELYDPASRELEQQGFTMLGDYVQENTDGAGAVARWFAHADGACCGWFGVGKNAVNGALVPLMMLLTQTDRGHYFTTLRGGTDLSLAQAPVIHRMLLPWNAGVASQLAAHRKQVAGGSVSAGAPRKIDGIDGALGLMRRLRADNANWRAAQPADVLIEADAKAVLRTRYGALGPALIKMMSARR